MDSSVNAQQNVRFKHFSRETRAGSHWHISPHSLHPYFHSSVSPHPLVVQLTIYDRFFEALPGTSVMVSPIAHDPSAPYSTPATLPRLLRRTRRQALLQLLGLVGVLEDEGVEVAVTPDLELDLVVLGALLYPRGC